MHKSYNICFVWTSVIVLIIMIFSHKQFNKISKLKLIKLPKFNVKIPIFNVKKLLKNIVLMDEIESYKNHMKIINTPISFQHKRFCPEQGDHFTQLYFLVGSFVKDFDEQLLTTINTAVQNKEVQIGLAEFIQIMHKVRTRKKCDVVLDDQLTKIITGLRLTPINLIDTLMDIGFVTQSLFQFENDNNTYSLNFGDIALMMYQLGLEKPKQWNNSWHNFNSAATKQQITTFLMDVVQKKYPNAKINQKKPIFSAEQMKHWFEYRLYKQFQNWYKYRHGDIANELNELALRMFEFI